MSDCPNEPKFDHDCSACTFLGTFERHDLYYCLQSDDRPTVIARYGNDGPDYMSGLAATPIPPQLTEARKRAIARGFLI